MTSLPPPLPDVEHARSFDLVADAYDRGRPTYPREAAQWLAGTERGRVLELGAGTGKLTEQLTALGHAVLATDPSSAMLTRLRERAPRARSTVAAAEALPVPARSVDVVVSAQAFHWFDPARALPEAARVLRPGGHLALVWNQRDERIPWVRRLSALLGAAPGPETALPALEESELFEEVESRTFRFWQPLTPLSLRDLVTSRSSVAVMSDLERERVLRKVDELYDEYGRGADGMLLPYVTHAYRARVRPQVAAPPSPGRPTRVHPDDVDTDALLIDFR
jgi:SAM-dependent methyltransferase